MFNCWWLWQRYFFITGSTIWDIFLDGTRCHFIWSYSYRSKGFSWYYRFWNFIQLLGIVKGYFVFCHDKQNNFFHFLSRTKIFPLYEGICRMISHNLDIWFHSCTLHCCPFSNCLTYHGWSVISIWLQIIFYHQLYIINWKLWLIL